MAHEVDEDDFVALAFFDEDFIEIGMWVDVQQSDPEAPHLKDGLCSGRGVDPVGDRDEQSVARGGTLGVRHGIVSED